MGKRKKIKQVLSKESNSKPSDLRFDVYLLETIERKCAAILGRVAEPLTSQRLHVYFSSLNNGVCENNRLFV